MTPMSNPEDLPVNSRIFLGTDDTSGVLSALAAGFRQHGYKTTTMVTTRHRHLDNTSYDIVRGREIYRRFDYGRSPQPLRGIAWRLDNALSTAINAIASPSYLEHDVFIFLAAAWAPEHILYPLLRRLGKRVVVYYLGSDVRHISAFTQEYGVHIESLARREWLDSLERKVRRIRCGELYANIVYSVPDQAGLQIRPYFHAYVPLDVALDSHISGREVPTVLHAPSRADVKGTSFVLEAVNKLREEGLRFEFNLLTDVPRTRVLEALPLTDIVIDQLLFHGPGVFGAEAMTAGCAVATRIIEPTPECFAPPVCPIRPDTIVNQLRRLIVDRPYRLDLAARGSEWVRKTLAPSQVAKKILEDLRGNTHPDYYPRFYLESFKPKARLSSRTLRLSRLVADRYSSESGAIIDGAVRRGVIASRPSVVL